MQSAAPGILRDPAKHLRSRDRIGLLRAMMLARTTEQRARTLVGREHDAEPAARWHREPIGAGAAAALRPSDRLIAPGRFVAAHLGRQGSPSVGASSSAADLVPVSVGVAFAVRAREEGDVVLTLVDEGAMACVRWSESLTLATASRLPLVLVVERDRAISPGASVTSSGQALLGEAVNAEDPEAVLVAVRAAVDRARTGRGPALVACVTARAAAGPPPWRRGTEGVEATPPERDPIELYARRLVRGGMPRADVESTLRAAEDEVVAWQP